MKRMACFWIALCALVLFTGVYGFACPVKEQPDGALPFVDKTAMIEEAQPSAADATEPTEEEIVTLARLLPEYDREEIIAMLREAKTKKTTTGKSRAEMIAEYQLENVETLSTPALFEEVLSYPYLSELLYFEPSISIRIIAGRFNGMRELLTRPDLQQSVMTYMDRRTNEIDILQQQFLYTLGLHMRSVAKTS